MREILFRGKAVNLHNGSNDFVYGQYVQNRDGQMIYSDTWEDGKQKHYVIEKTVGQYTGLTDKNGKKIFERDIVKLFFKDGTFEVGPIMWSRIDARYKFASPDGAAYGIDRTVCMEVIGNMHDNPELLRAQRKEDEKR